MSEISAVVKVTGSYLCGWGSISGKNCSFLIVSLNKDLSLCFVQHVQYRMPRGFPMTSQIS